MMRFLLLVFAFLGPVHARLSYVDCPNGFRENPRLEGGRTELESADIDNDGKVDILSIGDHGSPWINTQQRGVMVWFGDGSGGFVPKSTGLPSSSYGLAGVSVGDVDNDGGCDLAFCNTGGGVEVWRWDESGQRWTSFSGSLPVTGQFGGTQLCDMNADGFVDVCALGGGLLKVWAGDGAGNWTEAVTITIAASGSYSAFRVGADFDHNGRPDLALVLRETARNYAYAYREASPTESLTVFPVFPRGGEKFLGGSVQFVDWWSQATAAANTRVRLELSTQGQAGPWQLVADSLRNAGRYQWLVPAGAVSSNCFVRYTVYGLAGSAVATTSRAFTIGDPTGCRERCSAYARADVRVRPNPAWHRVTVELAGTAGSALLALYDATGRRVRTWPGVNGSAKSLDLKGLLPGVYYLSCRTAQGVSIARLGKTE